MRNLYKIVLLVTGLIISSSITLSAQSNYYGGQGGGYSSVTIGNGTIATIGDSIATKNFDATVYPNPLSSSDVLKAKINGIEPGEKVSIVVTNMIGSKILTQEIEISSEIAIDIPSDKLTKGIYLITFQFQNKKITRRFSFTN